MLLIEACLAAYGIYLIMICWDRLGLKRLNYPEIMEKIKGQTYRTLVIICLIGQNLGSCLSYIIIFLSFLTNAFEQM